MVEMKFYSSLLFLLSPSTWVGFSGDLSLMGFQSQQSESIQFEFVHPTSANQADPDFNSEGRPGTQTSAEGRGSCPQVDIPLMALMPDTNLVLSVDKPTLWFYIPYSSQDIHHLKFKMLDENDDLVYEDEVSFSENFNILSIHLSSNILEFDRDYTWALSVFCNDENSEDNNFDYVDVWGVVQRVQPSDRLTQQLEIATTPDEITASYAKYGIWSEAITRVSHSFCQASNNADGELSRQWQEFLQSVEGLESIEFLDSVICHHQDL